MRCGWRRCIGTGHRSILYIVQGEGGAAGEDVSARVTTLFCTCSGRRWCGWRDTWLKMCRHGSHLYYYIVQGGGGAAGGLPEGRRAAHLPHPEQSGAGAAPTTPLPRQADQGKEGQPRHLPGSCSGDRVLTIVTDWWPASQPFGKSQTHPEEKGSNPLPRSEAGVMVNRGNLLGLGHNSKPDRHDSWVDIGLGTDTSYQKIDREMLHNQ